MYMPVAWAAPESGCLPTMVLVHYLRLTHPELDFWVDVRLHEFDGRWLAVADLAGEPDLGMAQEPREALRHALTSLGTRLSRELAASAQVE